MLFGLVANIDEDLSGLRPWCQTDTAFDRTLEKASCPLHLGLKVSIFYIIRQEKDEGGERETKTNRQKWRQVISNDRGKRRSEEKNDTEKWEKEVLMRKRKVAHGATSYSVSVGSHLMHDTHCEAQMAPQICTEADKSLCDSRRHKSVGVKLFICQWKTLYWHKKRGHMATSN